MTDDLIQEAPIDATEAPPDEAPEPENDPVEDPEAETPAGVQP